MIYDQIAVGLYVDHGRAGRQSIFLCGRCFGNLDIEFVFIPRRIPGQQKENQKKKEDIDQRRELNARMMKGRATTQIHMSAMSILDAIATLKFVFQEHGRALGLLVVLQGKQSQHVSAGGLQI